jgi:hypothetical protein
MAMHLPINEIDCRFERGKVMNIYVLPLNKSKSYEKIGPCYDSRAPGV